jgi:hypothetical protein
MPVLDREGGGGGGGGAILKLRIRAGSPGLGANSIRNAGHGTADNNTVPTARVVPARIAHESGLSGSAGAIRYRSRASKPAASATVSACAGAEAARETFANAIRSSA